MHGGAFIGLCHHVPGIIASDTRRGCVDEARPGRALA
jgi:hypothetical protein